MSPATAAQRDVDAETASFDAPFDVLLEVDRVTKSFSANRSRRSHDRVRAVDDVSFTVRRGETLAVVGESGCGKSTLNRMIVGLSRPTTGSIRFDGRDIGTARGRRLRAIRSDIQMVFQDPHASLDPKMTVHDIIAEPLRGYDRYSRRTGRSRVAELLEGVGLSPTIAEQKPRAFSGGQRQRIAIARALALDPKLLVLDEPISALDVSVQGQILNLLMDLQDRLGLSYIFVSHDLSVVRHIADRVAVMYLGRIAEIGPAPVVFAEPRHPYTKALLSASPDVDRMKPDRIVLKGEPPSPMSARTGCVFHTRCWLAQDICAVEPPALSSTARDKRLVACHFPLAGETPVSIAQGRS